MAFKLMKFDTKGIKGINEHLIKILLQQGYELKENIKLRNKIKITPRFFYTTLNGKIRTGYSVDTFGSAYKYSEIKLTKSIDYFVNKQQKEAT